MARKSQQYDAFKRPISNTPSKVIRDYDAVSAVHIQAAHRATYATEAAKPGAEAAKAYTVAADAHAKIGNAEKAESLRQTAQQHAATAIQAVHAPTEVTAPAAKSVLGFSAVRGGTASGGHADQKSQGQGDDRKRDDHGRFA